MRFHILLFSVAITAFVGGLVGQTPVPLPDTPRGYLVGPGDELTGKVLGESQFDFVATIDVDGNIQVPFVEKPILAKCKTERDLRLEITELLKKYLRSPQLVVYVSKRDSRPPVSIYGEVRGQSQQVNLTRRAFLLELISFAGGETDRSGGMVQVFRTRPPVCAEPGQLDWGPTSADGVNVPSRMYSLAALKQGRPEANPEIFPGDIIVVQKAAPVYITGEVIKPGEMNIPEGGLRLMQAVAMANGMTREAKIKDIKIYRRKAGVPEPQIISANYDQIRKGQQKDVMLAPFDIIEVGKANKSIGQIFMDVLIGLPNRIPLPIRPF
ncbi:MAG TPA: polysaccharide biosynthesis/export family protein [Pyrinomonadaceae bacterium]|jgi:polysaccharide export outer membrane protein|nr:polysaccharide biosynthesis/export family protein [Pyrinomonadaceae bacterium]